MKPLNKKNRDKALMRFISLYVLTISLVGVLIYTTAFTIPSENANVHSNNYQFHQEFLGKLDSLNYLFSEMDKTENEIEWKSQVEKIAEQLVLMEKQLALENVNTPLIEKTLSTYKGRAKDKEALWKSRNTLAKQEQEVADNPALKECQDKLNKVVVLAGTISSQINNIQSEVNDIKGLGDKKQKRNIKEYLNQIRSYAERIQNQ